MSLRVTDLVLLGASIDLGNNFNVFVCLLAKQHTALEQKHTIFVF